MANKPITEFIEKYYLHFNAASLVDASKGYVAHLKDGGKMLITASASFQLVLKNITELEARTSGGFNDFSLYLPKQKTIKR